MKHHEEEDSRQYDYIYYMVGLMSGIFVGVILDKEFIWIPVLGLFGLVFAGFFLNVFVRGRGEKA